MRTCIFFLLYTKDRITIFLWLVYYMHISVEIFISLNAFLFAVFEISVINSSLFIIISISTFCRSRHVMQMQSQSETLWDCSCSARLPGGSPGWREFWWFVPFYYGSRHPRRGCPSSWGPVAWFQQREAGPCRLRGFFCPIPGSCPTTALPLLLSSESAPGLPASSLSGACPLHLGTSTLLIRHDAPLHHPTQPL